MCKDSNTTYRMIIEVNLTIEQRIELIQKTDKNFNILDIGIGPGLDV